MDNFHCPAIGTWFINGVKDGRSRRTLPSLLLRDSSVDCVYVSVREHSNSAYTYVIMPAYMNQNAVTLFQSLYGISTPHEILCSRKKKEGRGTSCCTWGYGWCTPHRPWVTIFTPNTCQPCQDQRETIHPVCIWLSSLLAGATGGAPVVWTPGGAASFRDGGKTWLIWSKLWKCQVYPQIDTESFFL